MRVCVWMACLGAAADAARRAMRREGSFLAQVCTPTLSACVLLYGRALTHLSQGISDRYREGLRPSDPVKDDSVNRLRFNFHKQYKQVSALGVLVFDRTGRRSSESS